MHNLSYKTLKDAQKAFPEALACDLLSAATDVAALCIGVRSGRDTLEVSFPYPHGRP